MAARVGNLGDLSEVARVGSVLLVVLVFVAIMSLTTGTYLSNMGNEYSATRYAGNQEQTRLLAESGVEFLKVFLAQSESTIAAQGGTYDNVNQLQAALVVDDAATDFRGRFSVISPNMNLGYYAGLKFGLEDESAKLNLNLLVQADAGNPSSGSAGAAGRNSPNFSGGSSGESPASRKSSEEQQRNQLLALPGMTAQIADAILDWIDKDDRPRAYGAESAYYENLEPAYRPRNGPLSSLDELLLVQGVTPELLYGVDSNRNFATDRGETPRGALGGLDNFNGSMDRGWSAYLTLYSSETTLRPTGEKKINLNASGLQSLYEDLRSALGEEQAKFVIAYRQFGVAPANSGERGSSASSLKLDFNRKAANRIESLMDLVAATVAVQQGEAGNTQRIRSPWQGTGANSQAILELFDVASTESGSSAAGKININAASRTVLLSIPSMTELLADQIISRRILNDDPVNGTQRHAVWLYTEQLVELEEMKELAPHVTAGGSTFSCQVAGFWEGVPGQSRLEVVIERAQGTSNLVAWTDLTAMGPGFKKNVLLGVPQTGRPAEP